MTTTFHLEGLTCEACVKLCAMKLKKLVGVEGVTIDLPTGRAMIEGTTPLTLEEANAALAGTHYRALPSA